jgi:hypothetical protein
MEPAAREDPVDDAPVCTAHDATSAPATQEGFVRASTLFDNIGRQDVAHAPEADVAVDEGNVTPSSAGQDIGKKP